VAPLFADAAAQRGEKRFSLPRHSDVSRVNSGTKSKAKEF
jgi:hypothetical protein